MHGKLRTKSVVDAVEEALRDRILAGEEKPGEIVTEVAVAARFGVGRPTAKAAVDRLAADGLLVKAGRRGTLVPVIGPEDVADIFGTRLLIEQAAHTRLAEQGMEPKDASVANVTLRHAATMSDAGRVIAADVEFHRALVEAAGSPRLRRIHASLMAETHVCMARARDWQLQSADVMADEHDEILRRIGAKDVDGTVAATVAHLQQARDKILESLARTQPETTPSREGERGPGPSA